MWLIRSPEIVAYVPYSFRNKKSFIFLSLSLSLALIRFANFYVYWRWLTSKLRNLPLRVGLLWVYVDAVAISNLLPIKLYLFKMLQIKQSHTLSCFQDCFHGMGSKTFQMHNGFGSLCHRFLKLSGLMNQTFQYLIFHFVWVYNLFQQELQNEIRLNAIYE